MNYDSFLFQTLTSLGDTNSLAVVPSHHIRCSRQEFSSYLSDGCLWEISFLSPISVRISRTQFTEIPLSFLHISKPEQIF